MIKSLPATIQPDPSDLPLAGITRLTLIDHTRNSLIGRVFDEWDIEVRLVLEDDERTLKVFVRDPSQQDPDQ